MIDRERGRILLSRVSNERWDQQRIKEAGEVGSGGWSCDRDRHLLIWLGNNAKALIEATMPKLMSEVEKLSAENTQLRAEIDDLVSWGASDARKELIAENERLRKEIHLRKTWNIIE
jgi:hypothetical protein